MEFSLGVFQLQRGNIKQFTTLRLGVENSNEPAPLPVRAYLSGGMQLIAIGKDGQGLAFAPFTFIEFVAGPEAVAGMAFGTRGGKEGFAPFFLAAHRGGHFFEFVEFRDSEIFVDIDVAVCALGGFAVGGEKIKRGDAVPGFDFDFVLAGQFHTKPVHGEFLDIFPEEI